MYLTGTLPVHGVSVVFYLPGQQPRIFLPECELMWLKPDCSIPVSFGWGHLPDKPIEENYRHWLSDLSAEFGSDPKKDRGRSGLWNSCPSLFIG